MISPCCYCGLSLDRASQYFGILDVLLGLLHFVILTIHLKEVYENDGWWVAVQTEPDAISSMSQKFGYNEHRPTFPKLLRIPPGLIIAGTVCYGLQFLMGIVLYLAASYKNRSACLLWLVITAPTCLFSSHFFVRIYEMLIVNEFARSIKEEQEVTYFPGQQPNPIEIHMQHYHHHHPPSHLPQDAINQQPVNGNILISPSDPRVGLAVIPTVAPSPYAVQSANPDVYPATNPYYGSTTPNHSQQQFTYTNIPPALQPPPRYDFVVGNDSAMSNKSSEQTVQSVIFPNTQNGFGNTFSKF